MYAAKASGTSIAVYTADLDAGRGDRLALLADLHLALEHDELELHYQPKLDLAFNVVTGVEALVRWTHPTRGPVPPDVFIPLAESTGLIDQLTRLVLAKALHQCRSWQDAGLDLTVAVNLSARNVMNNDLPDLVAVALVDAGLPAHKLILEITESCLMGDPERTIPTLERLSDIGVTLSLDDFGTGYSSLSYLQRLPVREVKIDRSFVLGLSHATDSHASGVLIRSIISLGTSLSLRIVAEGVETAEALETLRQLGCDIIQGYHIGRPVPRNGAKPRQHPQNTKAARTGTATRPGRPDTAPWSGRRRARGSRRSRRALTRGRDIPSGGRDGGRDLHVSRPTVNCSQPGVLGAPGGSRVCLGCWRGRLVLLRAHRWP